MFWVFMLPVSLLMPVMMICFGRRFTKRPPQQINGFFGYRTHMSMLNEKTWQFAHRYCGVLWHIIGWVLLFITLAVMLLVRGKSQEVISITIVCVCFFQTLPLLATIPITEKALYTAFDEEGNLRTEDN